LRKLGCLITPGFAGFLARDKLVHEGGQFVMAEVDKSKEPVV
jgi:hypothetical protein